MSSEKLRFFNSLSKPFVKIVEKYYPDAFIFVIVLSVLTFILALVNTEANSVEVLEAWGRQHGAKSDKKEGQTKR